MRTLSLMAVAVWMAGGVARGAVPATTDFDPVFFRTNALPVTIVGNLVDWQKLSTNAASSAMSGTVSNAVASAGLLAVDATKTNGVAATSAMVQAAAGQVWQATNANLTGWAGVAATSAGAQGLLGQVYQATNANLTSWAALAPSAKQDALTNFYADELVQIVSTNYTIVYTDNGKLMIWNSATNCTVFFGDGATNGFNVTIKTLGAGLVTITNASGKTFDGQASIQLPTSTISHWVADGTNYRGGRSSANNLVSANKVLASPADGSTNLMAARALVTADLPYTPVNKAGDTMTGTLTVTGLTNSARTANTFVVAGSDKSDVSTATSAMLAATLSDETGTGAVVFGTAPTLTPPVYIGGTSSSFPMLTNVGTTLKAMLGDNSTTAPFQAGAGTFTTLNTSSTATLTGGQINLGASTLIAWGSSPSLQNITVVATTGSGTDKAGGNIQYSGGPSTGTAPGGNFEITTSLSAEASGNVVNAQTVRAHYKPKYVALTHTTATTIETFSLAANKILGGTATITCYATNSTPHLQSLTSMVQFDAVAVGTTITSQIKQTDNTAAVDSGTLACTYTILDNGNNTFSIQANANSSLTTPTERAKVVVTALNGNSAITITDP